LATPICLSLILYIILDKSCALTLHREMLELLDAQQFGKSEELLWPAANSDLRSLSSTPAAVQEVTSFNEFVLCEEESTDKSPAAQHFDCFMKMDTSTGEALSRALPDGWSVVTINLTEDENTLFISRQQSNREPIVFAVSLNRQNKKEEDDEEEFTFQAATSELRDIIQTSDDTAKNAKNIDTREGRIEWWNTRKSLDKRLETLLQEIEYSWLGAFKVGMSLTCLRPLSDSSPIFRLFSIQSTELLQLRFPLLRLPWRRYSAMPCLDKTKQRSTEFDCRRPSLNASRVSPPSRTNKKSRISFTTCSTFTCTMEFPSPWQSWTSSR
jgi:hypothetical protein